MNEMKSGEPTAFRVEFSPKIVYKTMFDLLETFKREKVDNFEIEVFGWTINQHKVPFMFKHTFGDWSPDDLNLSRLDNLFAVAREHNNLEIFFNVLYQKPLNK